MNKTVKLILKIIMAYITTVVLGLVSGYGITGIDLLLPMVFAGILCVFISVDIYGRKEDGIYGWIMGSISSIAYVVGKQVVINDNERYVSDFSAVDIASIVVLTIFFAATLVLLLSVLDKARAGLKKESVKKNLSKEKSTKFYCLIFVIILICFLPYYIGMYPGNLGKDTFESVEMTLGYLPWTNHQPVFFTWLIGLVVVPVGKLFGLTNALGIFTFLHMLIYIATLSYIVLWLNMRGCSRWLLVISVLFFSLHPFMAMYSIYITKDVLFSCAFVMLILLLYDMVGTGGTEVRRKKSTWLRTSILLLLMIMLRNNAILICAGLFIALLLIYKENRRYIIVSAAAVLVLFGVFKGPICQKLNVAASSFAEVASVPLQQVGYVLINHPDRIKEADKEYLEDLLSSEELSKVYTLGYTDPYKFHPDFNDELINTDKLRFLKVWANVLPNNLGDYVRVYLSQTVGYWHYGMTNTVCTEGVADNALGVEQKGIPAIQELVSSLMLIMRKAPLLCIISSMASQMAMILLLVITEIRYVTDNGGLSPLKIVMRIIPYIPGLLLWMSIMLATPAYCLFRYMYPLFILWPVMCSKAIGD